MKENLILTPVKVNSRVMGELEMRGLIVRLKPSGECVKKIGRPGMGVGKKLYESHAQYGAHSLVGVSIDNESFVSFATHPDNEEFLLLGGRKERGLYLLVSLLTRGELEEKLEKRTLVPSDFILLDMIFNDPDLSFFIMKKGVPHGECAYGPGLPATFYVTEGASLPLEKIPLCETYQIKIQPSCIQADKNGMPNLTGDTFFTEKPHETFK